MKKKSFYRVILLLMVLSCLSAAVEAGDTSEKRAAALRIKTLIDCADSLFTYARTDSAEILGSLALELAKENFGEYDTLYARALLIRGKIHSRRADYALSESLFCQVLFTQENILGPDHPDVAITLNKLAVLYWFMGRYVEAEPLAKRALAIGEKAFGPGDSEVAEILFTLAMIYWFKGDTEAGGKAFHRARAIWKETLEPDHPNMGLVWGISAFTLSHRGKYEEAISSYRKALAIFENTFGPHHPWIGVCQNNLAGIYFTQDRFVLAESLYKEAIRTYETGFSPDHPFIASALRKLGTLCYRKGRYSEAESYYLQALSIMEKAFGPERASTFHLADLYGSMGDYQKATDHYIRAWNRRRKYIDYAFSYASEKQKMRYLENFFLVDYSHLTLSLLYDNPEIRHSALEMILESKAIVLDALAAEKEIAYCSWDDEIVNKVKELGQICGEISTITLAEAGGFGPPGYVEYLSSLHRAKDSLETELSMKCSEFKEAMEDRRLSVEDVAAALPDNGVLWEISQYWPYNFKEVGGPKFGPRRYLAFTLDHAGKITVTDLGSAVLIDSLISKCRAMIDSAYYDIIESGERKAERELAITNGHLYELIFAPLEDHLDGKKRILISPDGYLNLIPFEILPCDEGKYVMEKYTVSYLTSGRDLLRFKEKPGPSDWALVIANPDFDLSADIQEADNNRNMRYHSDPVFAYQPARGPNDCLTVVFGPLRYAENETESIVKILQTRAGLDVRSYCGEDALEANLKNISSPPRVLHIATHGYFCEDPERIDENPLLRSGLILAGANHFVENDDAESLRAEDGILTALEVSGLNLIGTELVTLPACKTGVGDVSIGEGVFGLRRSFQNAGARSMIMSLWSVPDRQTRELMIDFYESWLSGEAKSSALRNAGLRILNNRRESNGSAHPVFWGGFVLIGDSR